MVVEGRGLGVWFSRNVRDGSLLTRAPAHDDSAHLEANALHTGGTRFVTQFCGSVLGCVDWS